MLEVKHLNVFYGKHQALWDVSLKVDQGEFVAIIGSNGAGKTTLLKAISGILRPASGSIEFLGEKIHELPCHTICEMGLIHVPEGRRLFPLMTVQENLQMGASPPRARKEMQASWEKIVELFPILKERRHLLANTLSGGQQQMLAIGRGLMSLPKLFLLDEPTLGLSPKLAAEVLDCLGRFHRNEITIFLVSQEIARSLKLAQRAYVLENGRVSLAGSGKELLDNAAIRRSYLGL